MSRRLASATMILFAAILSPTTLAQTTIYVDIANCPGPGSGTQGDPFCKIQDGIDAADDGNEIIAAPGTYNETIDFLGKAVALRSAGGQNVTTIDGNGLNDSVVKCINGEGIDTVLDGFTITGGTGRFSPPPEEVLGGGGMFNFGSSPTVMNCTFTGNSAIDGDNIARGGGMYNLEGSSPVVVGCIFRENTATAGGGMYNLYDSNALVMHCAFLENTAKGAGGMSNGLSAPTVFKCLFRGNVATHAMTGAGGMSNGYGDSIITGCRFIGNSAGWGGAGILIFASSPIVTNCLFAHNSAGGGGAAGIAVGLEAAPQIINCTFYRNGPGGLSSGGGSSTFLANSVLWGNTSGQLWGPEGSLTVSFCNVQGGYAGTGNINADPMFVDPDGPDDDPETPDDNDYRLLAGSPCIDRGDGGAVPEGISTDLDDNPRFVDDPKTANSGAGDCPVVDMGAHEFQDGVNTCCPADLNFDGGVDAADLADLLLAWGPNPGHPADFDGDGDVDSADLAQLLVTWGPCL